MATLTDADIKRPSQREYATALEDDDVFVMEDVSEQKIKPITKTNAKATLGITDAEGTLADHETRLDTLEADSETEGSVAKSVKDAVEPIDERLTGLDTLTYEGITYMVSRKIENGHLVTTYTEVV
jgi:hypothetical protein